MSLLSGEMVSYVVRPGDTAYRIAQRFGTTVPALAAANPSVNLNNLSIGQVLTVVQSRKAPSAANNMVMGITRSQLELNNTMRTLWEQHAFLTRMVISAMVFDQPDVDELTARLLRNPKDFGRALTPFYGEKTAAEFAGLLTEHLELAAQMITAVKAGESNTAQQAETDWYANADAIAALLASINPYWSERVWKEMLHHHLRLVKDEAVALLAEQYEQAITILDELEQQALTMSDLMTAGIIKQFPVKFTK